MASFVGKNLGKQPIGTHVEVTYGDGAAHHSVIRGTITDSDFTSGVEITTDSGECVCLDLSIVRGLTILKPQGSVPKEVPTPFVPEDWFNLSDGALKEAFRGIPYEDQKKLSKFYDSFMYGIRIDDKSKMAGAANQAKLFIFQEDDKKYYWSTEAILFCGAMLRRANSYDPELFLIAECFEEAAYAAWQQKKPALAGAYAIVALLEKKPVHVKEMVFILSYGVTKGEDISGLKLFRKHLPAGFEQHFQSVVSDAFQNKGFQPTAQQNMDEAMAMLAPLYPKTEMAEEVLYWLPKAPVPPPKPAPAKPKNGFITHLRWMDRTSTGTITGTITSSDGILYPFRYQDIIDVVICKEVQDCLSSNLDGKVFPVKFLADKSSAKSIQRGYSLVDKARTITADAIRADRFEVALELCKKALSTPDVSRAIRDVVKLSMSLYKSTQQLSYIQEALSLYEKHSALYPDSAFDLIDVAQCYHTVKKYPQMVEVAQKALRQTGLPIKARIDLLSRYLRLAKEYYDAAGDKAILPQMLEKIDQLKAAYHSELTSDPMVLQLYNTVILPYRVIAQCGLDRLDEAEANYALVPDNNIHKPLLDTLMAKLRSRMAPKEVPVEDPAPPAPVEEASEEPVPVEEPVVEAPASPAPQAEESYDEDEEPAEAPEEEILPYVDTDGWPALKLTKQDVVDYALSIGGEDRIPAILAYLRSGASLCADVAPVYHTVALAANDPLEAPDYSITALVNALATSDTDYPQLNDCCMGAAFLRASFLSGRGYDYSAQGLRDSISIIQQLPALREACDTLEQFRNETGRAIDIYADYRNQGVMKLNADMDATVRRADELFTKYILSPPREKASFLRILETRKLLFHRDGYLAVMLKHIMERNQDALEAEKDHFAATYLNGTDQFSAAHISSSAVDALVLEAWEGAGKNMQMKKNNSTLQGDRRNNLRSSVSEIISTVCQWYALSQQSAGLSWRTEQGADAYARLRPQLMSRLEQLHTDCMAELDTCADSGLATGLFLLAATARELSARLDGSWKFDQEKYLYVDFLRGNHVLLNEDFMPELSSTFCVLPEFNILARIRQHVEAPKLTFQEQIDRIFSMDKTCNNYGTAYRILAYLEAVDDATSVTLPDNFQQFLSQTELLVDMGYRDFQQTYAQAMSYGQIIKSDAFCCKLEDTIRYWYAFCKETRNYGFFTSILQQAKKQIHVSARTYEIQLEEQLDALIAGNRQYFDGNPGYAEAIRAQIAEQNFTVAEDWMARIRIGDFSLEVQQAEALGYLERFWNSFVATYSKVADAGYPLGDLLGRRAVRNKDTKGAQQLIDNWLRNGNPSNTARIGQLLNLLGWKNIQVSQYPFAAEPRAEIYEVRTEVSTMGLPAPRHPIAAFGSTLEKKRMHVACLYGTYDCDRLYEKMRTLDVIEGSKIILLDYALGQADRRALARKLKRRESGLRNVYIVIDRVLITHLSNNYNENLINRILMAIAMPFSYCQPYVVDSAHTMPPEIFIGRKDELLRIEQADGVNLIYGGRQLGKSALFKKALSDLDGRDKKRAVLVDIQKLDCAAAARKVSMKLIDLGITPDAEITEDWDILCRNIERRLRSGEEEITYFLLMLDEADTFINDCANWNYRPLVALKDVQQSLPGQFKYVLAGLHDVVKFNRQVALGNNSVIPHMASLKIRPFRTPEAQELLTGPLSYLGFSLPSKVTVSQILATCNYFPGLIQLYAKKLIESLRAADYAGYNIKTTPPYVVSDEHLRRIMADKEFVAQIHEKFEMTLTLDQDQGSCYYPLTLLIGWMYSVSPNKEGYTARDVVHHARDLSVYPLAELDEEKIEALLQELQDLNILTGHPDAGYLLASKNFRDLLGSDEEIFEKLTKVGGAVV